MCCSWNVRRNGLIEGKGIAVISAETAVVPATGGRGIEESGTYKRWAIP